MNGSIQKAGKFVFTLTAAVLFFALTFTVEAAGGSQDGGPIVVYTNSGTDGRGEWITEAAKTKGFDVQIVPMGSGDLTNRIVAEKANPVADVIFGPNSMDMERMVREEALQKYQPSWVDELDKALVDSKGLYVPIGMNPLVFAYNTDFVKGGDIPKDWNDIATNPKYKDKYTILSLGGGTGRVILSSFLLQHKDPNGQHGISNQGWDLMKSFIQNGHIQETEEDWWGKVVSGERPITELWLSGVVQRMQEGNLSNVDIIGNAIGVPYIVENIALSTRTKNLEKAKAFVEWFGSVEAQTEWSRRFGHLPARADAQGSISPVMKGFLAKLRSQPFDWALCSANIDKWVEKIQLEFVK
jgi:iron(III) transport system substrate-binding protein